MLTRTPTRLIIAPVINRIIKATVRKVEFIISTNLPCGKEQWKFVVADHRCWSVSICTYSRASWYFFKHAIYSWYNVVSLSDSHFAFIRFPCSLLLSRLYGLKVIISISWLRNLGLVILLNVMKRLKMNMSTYPMIENKLQAWVVQFTCIVSIPATIPMPIIIWPTM